MPQSNIYANFSSLWDQIRKNAGFDNKYLVLVFVTYVILLAIAIYKHEPWMDEAQAWLLVKDLNVVELFVKYLRYEGSPGLWHLVLMIPAKLGLPYFTLNIISGIFSALGVWLFLRFSPFPLLIKILFPFSYFIFFQYGVVARSYCLIAPLLFLIAIKYETKIKQPFIYIGLLSLFANISFHTLLLSCGFLFVHLLDLLKVWQQLERKTKIHQILATVMFGLMIGLLYLVISPPPDQLFASQADFRVWNFIGVSKWALAGSLVTNEMKESVWLGFTVSFAVIIWTIIWLRRQKTLLLYLASLLPLLAFFAVKYRNIWHTGIVFFLWLFVVWINFEKSKNERPSIMAKTMIAFVAIVLGVQVYWSAFAIKNDFNHSYSASYQVAEYIKANNLQDKKIYASGWKSIAIAPYFNHKIFFNHNKDSDFRFWFWSNQNQTVVGFHDLLIEEIQNEKPDLVIFASDHFEGDIKIELDGYSLTEVFEGNIYWKTGAYELDSFLLFTRIK